MNGAVRNQKQIMLFCRQLLNILISIERLLLLPACPELIAEIFRVNIFMEAKVY